jgi:hypothetical protein
MPTLRLVCSDYYMPWEMDMTVSLKELTVNFFLNGGIN